MISDQKRKPGLLLNRKLNDSTVTAKLQFKPNLHKNTKVSYIIP